MVEPGTPIGMSVLPDGDPEHAAALSAGAGIPADLLARFGATVRQTHRRANVVVIDVPAERQTGLIDALGAIGLAARPPHAMQPLLNESVPALGVPVVWAGGHRGRPSRLESCAQASIAASPFSRDLPASAGRAARPGGPPAR